MILLFAPQLPIVFPGFGTLVIQYGPCSLQNLTFVSLLLLERLPFGSLLCRQSSSCLTVRRFVAC